MNLITNRVLISLIDSGMEIGKDFLEPGARTFVCWRHPVSPPNYFDVIQQFSLNKFKLVHL